MNGETIKTDLTKSQWALRDLLDNAYPNGLTKEEIFKALNLKGNVDDHNDTTLQKLYQDFQALKDSSNLKLGVYGCIDKKHFKRLTPNEWEIYAQQQENEIKDKYFRYKNQQRRARLNGQINMQFNYEKPIVDTFKSFEEEYNKKTNYSDEELMQFGYKELQKYCSSVGGYVVNGWTKEELIKEIRLTQKKENK